ncbi:hypothetical protein D9756_003895 [Leucocoprinus leucothites]|uniref:Uncharacterized protein n=1 Tax=Leucocoprinus leucothites TaxID=201217 RepID=A0A8H5D9V8_9AGAR|nr:hypothetical protein D9756_003895 [Leucoagaricus leucothites]
MINKVRDRKYTSQSLEGIFPNVHRTTYSLPSTSWLLTKTNSNTTLLLSSLQVERPRLSTIFCKLHGLLSHSLLIMPEVQAQPLVTSRSSNTSEHLVHVSGTPLFTYLLVLLYITCSLTSCVAQTLINGQVYTNGLAIIDAPAPNSQQHVGSTMPIAIEVSGNGKLPFSALSPGSKLASSYELLEIYLVSSQAGLNFTISSGSGLLTGETGTLTFYETSYINSQPYFTITPIPISILSSGGSSSSCTEGINQLQEQPQPDADFGQSPFLPNSNVVVSTGGLVSGAAPTQTRDNESDVGSSTPIATGPTTFIEGPTPTYPPDEPTKPSGSVTLVIVAQVVTTTTNSLNEPITTSYMSTRTTTVPMNSAVNAGVIPINAGTARLDHLTCIFVPLLVTIWAITLFLRLD